MPENDHQAPGLLALARKLAATGLGALRSRGELLAVEWQIERARLAQALVMAVICVVLSLMALGVVTAIVILLCPEGARLYVAGAFAVLYLAGAVAACLRLTKLLKEQPLAESLNQLKKDRECLTSFN